MLKSPIIASLGILALSVIPSATPFGAAPANAVVAMNDAVNECLSLSDNSLYNNCGFTVWATWCVENVDCRNGKFSNLEDIGAGRSYPVYGASTGNTVRYGACRAPAMPIDDGNYTFRCDGNENDPG
jgi:hypothetical protein